MVVILVHWCKNKYTNLYASWCIPCQLSFGVETGVPGEEVILEVIEQLLYVSLGFLL